MNFNDAYYYRWFKAGQDASNLTNQILLFFNQETKGTGILPVDN